MPLPSSATAFGDSDIPALMADMGIAVTINSVAGIALLDEVDEVQVEDYDRGVRFLQHGSVVSEITALTIRTSDFPGAAIGQTVAIGARNFTIRERLRIGDGGLTKLLLGILTVSMYQPSEGPQFAFADGETPGGVADGVNVTFMLAFAPNPAASLILVMNGLVLEQGDDYTLSGNTITFLSAPLVGADLEAWYRY